MKELACATAAPLAGVLRFPDGNFPQLYLGITVQVTSSQASTLSAFDPNLTTSTTARAGSPLHSYRYRRTDIVCQNVNRNERGVFGRNYKICNYVPDCPPWFCPSVFHSTRKTAAAPDVNTNPCIYSRNGICGRTGRVAGRGFALRITCKQLTLACFHRERMYFRKDL